MDDLGVGLPVSRAERIKAHMKRVSLDEAVHDVKESVDTGLSPEEIQERLKHIRGRITNIETHLTVSGDTNLADCAKRLEDVCKRVSEVRQVQAAAMQKTMNVRRKYDDRIQELEVELRQLRIDRQKELAEPQTELEKIKETVEPELKALWTVAEEMRSVCKALKISDARYLSRVYNLDPSFPKTRVEIDPHARRDLPTSWFAPEIKKKWIEWKIWLKSHGVTVVRDRTKIPFGQELNGVEAKAALGNCDKTILREIMNDD